MPSSRKPEPKPAEKSSVPPAQQDDGERDVDEALKETFPASDPPSWVPTTGVRSAD